MTKHLDELQAIVQRVAKAVADANVDAVVPSGCQVAIFVFQLGDDQNIRTGYVSMLPDAALRELITAWLSGASKETRH